MPNPMQDSLTPMQDSLRVDQIIGEIKASQRCAMRQDSCITFCPFFHLNVFFQLYLLFSLHDHVFNWIPGLITGFSGFFALHVFIE